MRGHRRGLRIAGLWVTGVMLLLFNILVSVYENRYRDAVRKEGMTSLTTRYEMAVSQSSQALSDYLVDVMMELRLISQIVAASGLEAMPTELLQTITRHDIERNWVTEIYIVENGFTGERPPIAAFEFDDDKQAGEVNEEHDLSKEDDEYRELVQHLRTYGDQPDMESLLSATLELCARKRGQVLTVPIHAEGGLLGLAAAMLPIEFETVLLRDSAHETQTFVVNSAGRPINADPDTTVESVQWLAKESGGQSPTCRTSASGLVAVCPVDGPARGRWAVAAILPAEDLDHWILARTGGPWNTRLVVTLGIGNALGLCLLSLVAYWCRRAQVFQRQAERDSLTGAFSRRVLGAVRADLRARCEVLGVIAIDLNNFKQCNDTLGHETGDRLLAATARLLQQSVRASDIVVRTGGDEFLILLRSISGTLLNEIIERIRQATRDWNLANPLDGVSLSLSVGAVLGTSTRLDELIAEADERMYKDKAGRYAPKDHQRT